MRTAKAVKRFHSRKIRPREKKYKNRAEAKAARQATNKYKMQAARSADPDYDKKIKEKTQALKDAACEKAR